METLDATEWDVVIGGTGLAPSLLALSLSRSGKKVLHLDRNTYYGGREAALSLAEAEAWAEKHVTDQNIGAGQASIHTPDDSGVDQDDARFKLASSRAYSLSLAPQLLFAQSNLIPALVSSQTHSQLEFQAVGSWFIVEGQADGTSRMTRVPSGREDVFSDNSLDLKAKRALMKFIRFVGNYHERTELWEECKDRPFPNVLEEKFGLPSASHTPLFALTLAQKSLNTTSFGEAVPAIERHLQSIGVFGPGFGAVIPKWGGLAEIAQVACRAGAVGGGVYVLDKEIHSCTKSTEDSRLSLQLGGGETVTTRWLVTGLEDVPRDERHLNELQLTSITVRRSISIVSSNLSSLLPRTSEGGVLPAGAVVMVSGSDSISPPVYILVHSSDAGECPTSQCVLYASVESTQDVAQERLNSAIAALLTRVDEEDRARILWQLQFTDRFETVPVMTQDHSTTQDRDNVIKMSSLRNSLALEDDVLKEVERVWCTLSQEKKEDFMKFESREHDEDEN